MFASVSRFARKHWFLIGLFLVMLLGFNACQQLAWMQDANRTRSGLVAIVIFLTALPIETAVIRSTLRRPAAAILGTVINFGVLPLMGWGLSFLLRGDLALGLLVVSATPCTVASAALWTRRAGGNEVVALCVTVVTNATCFFVTSVWLGWMTQGNVNLPHIAPQAMIQKLALLILLPGMLAQLIRQVPSVSERTRTHRTPIATVTQIGLLGIVGFGAVRCGLHMRHLQWMRSEFLLEIVVMLALCIGLHGACLYLGRWIGRMIGLSREDWIAAGFAGSQKTLAVGLQVALMVGGGMVILPMVAYHVLQLVIDTLVADHTSRSGMPAPTDTRR